MIYYFWCSKKLSKFTGVFKFITFKIPVDNSVEILHGIGSFQTYYWRFKNVMKSVGKSGAVKRNHYLRKKWSCFTKSIRQKIELERLVRLFDVIDQSRLDQSFIRTFGPGRVQDISDYEFKINLKAMSHNMKLPKLIRTSWFNVWDPYLQGLNLVEVHHGRGWIIWL